MLQSQLPMASLTVDSLRNMQSRLYRENSDKINGLSFSNNGELMVTSSDDDSIVVYDLITGTKQRKINFPKTGCSLIRFLHTPNDVILASNKNGTIRHFSLYNHQCIRLFRGHENNVSHIAVSPDDDLFLSSSKESVRLWDVRTSETLAALYFDYNSSDPNVSFDPEGLIFAVTENSKCIKLFDKRQYGNGPFSTFDLSHVQDSTWNYISFSPDGKTILIVTDGNHLRLVESYDGIITHTLTGHSNENRLPLRAAFTPCNKFVFVGGSDGTITFWLTDTGNVALKLKADHAKPIQIVDFNPKYHMFASTCQDTKIWMPNSNFTSHLLPNSFGYNRNAGY